MGGFDMREVRHLAVDLADAPAEVRAKAPVVVAKTLHAIEADAKVIVKKDTGNLAGSISTDIDPSGLAGEVGPTADYGADVEYGTQPHEIRPKTPGGVLAFPGAGGGTVFAKVVHHPGTAPAPYMGPAFDRHAPLMSDALGDTGQDIL